MYLPKQFDVPQHAVDLMRENPFASLISNDDEGFPYVTHLPLHVEQRSEGLYILGHCARGNPHWKYLQSRAHALVTFMGPHAYMSPQVYPDLVRVPTWNYLTVHAMVNARIVDAEQSKDVLLKQLIADHEWTYAQQWRGLPETYTHQMLSAIVAFELKVEKLQSKFKLNQHRPEAHAKMCEAYQAGTEQARGLAMWMHRLGMVKEPSLGIGTDAD
jgi:transcriptional regulator